MNLSGGTTVYNASVCVINTCFENVDTGSFFPQVTCCGDFGDTTNSRLQRNPFSFTGRRTSATDTFEGVIGLVLNKTYNRWFDRTVMGAWYMDW